METFLRGVRGALTGAWGGLSAALNADDQLLCDCDADRYCVDCSFLDLTV